MREAGVKAFFAYAREREAIQIARANGNPHPWTRDPILGAYKFCNIFREDDKTTRWFVKHVRGPLSKSDDVVMATVIFRWFNRMTTGQALLDHDLFVNWNSERAMTWLRPLPVIFTGAYIINSDPGMKKLDSVCGLIDNVWRDRERLVADLRSMDRLEDMWGRLASRYPRLGNFLAYEMVTDLRFTDIGGFAIDINSWASPGPGAARGTGRILHGDAKRYDYYRRAHRHLVIDFMRELLEESRNPEHWPVSHRPWEMREVEHTLCEFDKYERVRLGEGAPREKYKCER